jgi:putative PEP-CTERM system TPR-repeat lipoprotein
MRFRHSLHLVVVLSIATMLVAGCSQSPEALLASAKDYLSKKDNKAAVIQLRNALQKRPDLAEARFLLGKTLLDSGDVPGAEKELRKALELQYPADHVVPRLARSLILLGRYKEVADELVRIEISDPQGKAELLAAVGQAHLALRNVNAARNAFDMAVAAQPKYIPPYLGQARILAGSGNLAGAMTTVDAALAMSPTDSEAWQLKGDILFAQKEIEPALAAYRKGLEANPQFVIGHVAIVSLLMSQNKLEDAAKQMDAMKQIAPRHPQTFYLQALVAYRQKNFNEARQSIQQLLRGDPDNLRNLLLAGAIDLELKSYAQAEAYLSKVVERVPRQGFARRALIATYLRSGQPAKALDTDPNMLAIAGEVFMMNGQPGKAADYFARSAALDPGDTRKQTAVALSHIATGETDRGSRELEQVAAIDTGIRADLALIATHMQRREYDKALSAIAAIEKKQPGSALPHDLRGGVLLAKRDTAAARRSFERALEIDATYVPAAANLAQLDLAEKKPDMAAQRFQTVLAKDPNNVQALLGLAALRANTPRDGAQVPVGAAAAPDPEVVKLLTKAIGAQPTSHVPRAALIRYYIGMNDAKKAARAAQEAVAAMPDQPEILDAAGRAYEADGDTYQAVRTYQKLASVQRGSPQPYLRMAEVQAPKSKDDAMESLRKALAIQPDLIDAQRALIRLSLDAGRVQDAMSTAREVQKQRPKESVGYIFEGDVYASQKKWAEAAGVYRTGLERVGSADLAARLHAALSATAAADAEKFAAGWIKDHPKDGAFRLYLAQAAGVRNDYQTAAQHYRKLLEGEPDNAVLLNNLAFVEGRLKDPKAVEHAEQANKLAPNQAAIMDTLGVLLVEKGDTARGLELLQKASASAPQAAAIRLNFAKALIKAGQKDAARKELDELTKLGDKFSGQREVAELKQAL